MRNVKCQKTKILLKCRMLNTIMTAMCSNNPNVMLVIILCFYGSCIVYTIKGNDQPNEKCHYFFSLISTK